MPLWVIFEGYGHVAVQIVYNMSVVSAELHLPCIDKFIERFGPHHPLKNYLNSLIVFKEE